MFIFSGFEDRLSGFYGWGGIGGSWFVFHPEKQVGVAYTPNGLAVRGRYVFIFVYVPAKGDCGGRSVGLI